MTALPHVKFVPSPLPAKQYLFFTVVYICFLRLVIVIYNFIALFLRSCLDWSFGGNVDNEDELISEGWHLGRYSSVR